MTMSYSVAVIMTLYMYRYRTAQCYWFDHNLRCRGVPPTIPDFDKNDSFLALRRPKYEKINGSHCACPNMSGNDWEPFRNVQEPVWTAKIAKIIKLAYLKVCGGPL